MAASENAIETEIQAMLSGEVYLACENVERIGNDASKLLRGASTVFVEDTAAGITHA